MDNHRYDPVGGQCRCGKHKYHEEHFNGDRELAGEAYKAHLARQQNHIAWLADLGPGDFAQVRDGDYEPMFVGRDNRIVKVVQRGSDGTTRKLTGDGRDYLVRTPRSDNIVTWWCNSNVLEAPQMPVPPKFSSVEEADEWLERNAVEFGLDPGPKPEQPMFATQEEADDWLRKQAGVPYVPEGWLNSEAIVGKLNDEQLDELNKRLERELTNAVRGDVDLALFKSAFRPVQILDDKWPPQVSPNKIGIGGLVGVTGMPSPGGPPPPGSMPTPVRSFTCPGCHIVSTNSNDVDLRYCGACHQFWP